MPGLGLGISAVTADAIGGGFSPALIDDLFFELDGNSHLQPRSSFVDNHDTWDLDGNSHIMPAATPGEEGLFDIDGDGNIIPKA